MDEENKAGAVIYRRWIWPSRVNDASLLSSSSASGASGALAFRHITLCIPIDQSAPQNLPP